MATVVRGPKRRNSLAAGYFPEIPAERLYNIKLVEPEPPPVPSTEPIGPNTSVTVIPLGDMTFAWGSTLMVLRGGVPTVLEPAQVAVLDSLGGPYRRVSKPE